MRKPAPRLPSPYKPHPKPHLTRTAVLLALTGAMLAVIVGSALELERPGTVLPQREITRPYDGYDPGLYTPFTHPPESPR